MPTIALEKLLGNTYKDIARSSQYDSAEGPLHAIAVLVIMASSISEQWLSGCNART
jgi:hypothetical protein